MPITAAELIVKVGADTSAAERDLARFNNRSTGMVGGLKSAFGGLGSALGGMFSVAAGMGMYSLFTGVGRQVQGLTSDALQAYATFERLGMSLTAMGQRELVNTGQFDTMADSLEAASLRSQELVGWIEQLAIESPFTQEDVFQALRLAQAYGFTSEQAKRLTKATTDFAAGTGASGYVIDRIGLALGQVQARGKLVGTEVRQLTEAGVNVNLILSKAFGVTTQELQKMIENGLVPADAAVEAIIQSFEKDFPNAAKNQATTFSGLISSMQDVKAIGLRDFFAGTFKAIQPYLQSFVDWFANPIIRQSIRDIGDDLGLWIEGKLKSASDAAKRFSKAFSEGGGGTAGFIRGTLAAMGLPAPENMVSAIQGQLGKWGQNIQDFLFGGGWQAAAQDMALTLDLEGLKGRVQAEFAKIDWSMAIPFGIANKISEALAAKIDSVDWASASQKVAGFVDDLAAAVDSVDWTGLGTRAGGFFSQIIGMYSSVGDLFASGGNGAKTGFGKLRLSIETALEEINWETLDLSFTGLQGQVQKAWAEFQAGFEEGSGMDVSASMQNMQDQVRAVWESIDNTMQYIGSQNMVDDLTARIEATDWNKMAVDFSKMMDELSLQISSLNWWQLGQDFGKKLMDAFSSENVASSLNFTGLTQAIGDAWNSIRWSRVNFSLSGLVAAIEGAISSFVLGTIDSIRINFPGWDALIEWPQIEVPDWTQLLPWPQIEAPDWGNLIAWPSLGEIIQMIQDAVQEKISSWGWGQPSYNPGANSGNFSRRIIEDTSPYGAGLMPAIPGGANGFRKFRGGLAVVGEEGPELVRLPAGADVFSNPQSLALLRAMGIPGFAEGTLPGTGMPTSGASSMWGNDVFYSGDLSQALTSASGDLEESAKMLKSATTEFGRMLQNVPGLFGTSKVTDEQMKLAELGVPQDFADNYLRRLTDEVMNGVDWEGVDIKDAAMRAGIDPNLPAEAILQMFRGAWEDSSLFSDPNNLDLINQDAVKSAMQRQADSQMGKANLAELFGIPPEEQAVQMQNIIGGMIAGITPEATAPLGDALFSGIQGGVTTAAAASGTGEEIADGIKASISAPTTVKMFRDTGEAVAGYIIKGINEALANFDWSGITPPAGSGVPPAGGGSGGSSGSVGSSGSSSRSGRYSGGLDPLPAPRGYQTSPTGESRNIVINAIVPDNILAERIAQRVARIERRRNR